MYHYIYLIPLSLSAIFSLRSFGLKWPKPYRIFSVFLILTLFTELFAIAWKWYLYETPWWSYNDHNSWIYNSFHIGRYALLALFYYRILNSRLVKKAVLVSGILILCFGVINYIFIQKPGHFNSYTLILTNISGVLLSLMYFRQVIRGARDVKMRADPVFWISLGVFIYCSVSIPYFIYTIYLFDKYPNYTLVLYFNDVLNVMQYTSYLIAFLCQPHQK